MAMTIGDANAAQTLIGWIVDRDRQLERGITPGHVTAALEHLADRSSRALMAGKSAADVQDRIAELGGLPS